MKFSDIQKKKSDSGKAPEAPKPLPNPEIPSSAAGNTPPPTAPPSRIELADAHQAASEQNLESQRQSAQQVYGQAIGAVRGIMDNIADKPVQAYQTLISVARSITNLIQADNQALLALATSSTAANYLYAHAVNTAIFSVLAGHGFGWGEKELQSLAVCGLLQDIGMVPLLDLASQPRELLGPEKEKVRSHPLESQKLLENIEDMDADMRKWVSEVIGQESAWKSGGANAVHAGKTSDVAMMARILGLCDLYEAMTHPRAWRKGISPHEMIKNLLKQRRQNLEPVFVKNFVERLSLFPPGCMVQLSTHESGYVVKVYSELPTRPTIELRVRADGGVYTSPRFLNLGENPTTHIIAAIEESQAGIKDPEVLKNFEANRWWTE